LILEGAASCQLQQIHITMNSIEIDNTLVGLGVERISFFIATSEHNGVEMFDVDLGDGLIASRIKSVPYSHQKEVQMANEGKVHWRLSDFVIVCLGSGLDLPHNYFSELLD